MRKSLATLALLCALMSTTSCIGGPFRLYRTWDDFFNQKYTESPWLHGALLGTIIPVYPIVGGFLYMCDAIVINTWTFWSKDAFPLFEETGTGYDHKALSGAKKSVTGWGFD